MKRKHNKVKEKKSIYKSIIRYSAILLFIVSIAVSGCGKETFYYSPEELANFLDLDESQQEQILPKLKEIQEEIIAFYREWLPALRKQEMGPVLEPDSAIENARKEVWEYIREVGEKILPLLHPRQQEKLSHTALPDLEIRELFQMQRNKEIERSKHMKGSRKIDPAMTIPTEQVTAAFYRKMLESRTLSIGVQRFSMSHKGKVSKGFPLFIKATILDNALIEFEKAWKNRQNNNTDSHSTNENNENLQIHLALSTYFHKSYLDLNRWIVYLETNTGLKIEPLRTDKKAKPFFREEPDPFRAITLSLEQWASTDSIPYAPDERSGRNLLQNSYYTLNFSHSYEGEELLGTDQKALKLIFLNEVNGEDKAEGTWEIIYRDNRRF